MEYNIQKYNFTQNGKEYVVSTGIVGDRIRITCQENLAFDGPFYCNEFTLYDLRTANQFFNLTQTPNEALNEINKGIERQKSALRPGPNDTIHFLGYLVIGTDNDVYTLILRRDFYPNKYGIFTPPSSNAADLVLTTNYQVDGERLNTAEINVGNLEREQTFLEEELNKAIPEINKLKKLTLDIEEENALIRERLKILQKQLEQRKYNVIKLKEENLNLKRENMNLNNRIKNQENIIRNKQAIQATIKVQGRPNINHGDPAITSKFEQSELRTFLPRTGAKPTTQDYPQNINYTTTIPTQIITNTNLYQNNIETQYLPPVYHEPKIIVPQPIILNIQQPIINNTPQKLLRGSDYSINSQISYKTPTYIAYLSTPGSKELIYKNRVNDPNYYKNISNNRNPNKDVPYSSHMVNLAASNKDVPYNSAMAQNISNTNILLNNNNPKLEGSNNKMGFNSVNNVSYNSRMAQTESDNKNFRKPIGSRLPKENFGNYSDKPLLSKSNKSNNSSNDNKLQTKNSLIIGYSSYQPEKK